MSRAIRCLSLLAVLVFACPRASGSELLIDNFLTNGGVSEPSLGLDSAGATGPTNKLFTGLGTNAIGDRTTYLEVPAGVPAGGYAYVEPTGTGTALFYNSGVSIGTSSMHRISWAAGNFDLISAVGVSSPNELFFRLDFGVNNFLLSPTQVFEMRVSSAGGDAFYSATVNSNVLVGSTNFSTLLSFQSGTFNATGLTIDLSADLAFAGVNNQVEFTGVSVVPEPSTLALLGVAFASLAVIRLRRRSR